MTSEEKLGIAKAGLTLAEIGIRSILEAYSGIPEHVRKALAEVADAAGERYERVSVN